MNGRMDDPRRVHLKGFKPCLTEDFVKAYIKSISGRFKIQEVQLGSNNNALVTLDEQDLEHLEQAIKKDKKGLDGCTFILERIPYCTCILVSGLSSNTTPDAIKFYFENPKKGCGEEPSKIELQQELGTARLYFKDHSVVEILLEKHHVLDDAELKIEPFYQFLGQECKATKIDVQPEIMAYIKKNYNGELQSVLDENEIELQWTLKETSAVIKEMNTGASGEVNGNIKRKAAAMLSEFLESFEHRVITVDCTSWEEVTEGLHEKIDTKDEKHFTLFCDEASYSIAIEGKKQYIVPAVKQIEIFAEEVTEKRRIESSVEEHIEEDISSEHLAVLKIANLIDHLQESYRYTTINVDDEKGTVIIRSPKDKLPAIKEEVLRFLRKIEKEILVLNERKLNVLFLRREGAT